MARARFPVWLMALLLALVTIALYWPVTGHDFINYDDGKFITGRPQVASGLSWENTRWAFRSHPDDYWRPLTLLSFMLDCEFFGLNAGGHHLSSVALHLAGTLLLFLVLHRLSGARWRSACVAGLFAWHPLQVEPVAWAADRGDVLEGCFWMLTLWAYVRYAQSQKGRPPQSSILNYVLALAFFACGLMSKPTLITLPFALLLLDYWPLHRFELSAFNLQRAAWRGLVLEKLPFLALSGLSSFITFLGEKSSGSIAMNEKLALSQRLGNALVSYVRYLGKTFWPAHLAVFYPHPGTWPPGQVIGAGLLLVAAFLVAICWARERPYLLVGWLWFLGTLVPVIGLIQVGSFSMADRYSYIPLIGVLVLAIWGAEELIRRWRYQVPALSVAGGAAMVLCLALTRQQISYWQDSESLFRHAIAVTDSNSVAHNNLGNSLLKKGQTDVAITQFQEVIRLRPGNADAYNNLGTALDKNGQTDAAISQFQEAIRLKPGFADVHYNLGIALDRTGQTDAAISQYQQALRLKPDYAAAHNNLGNALVKKGQTDEAISQYQEAIRLKPDNAQVHYNLGTALGRKGQTDAAISQFEEALRLRPDFAEAHYNLGTAFTEKGQMDAAISQYQQALRLYPDNAEVHNNLGNALYRKGRTSEAIRQFQEALRLKPEYADARKNLDIVLAAKADSPQRPGASTNP